MRALILNDTSRAGHLGCSLVMSNLVHGVIGCGFTSHKSISLRDIRNSNLQAEICKSDLVILNGEGTMHDDQPAARRWTELCMSANSIGKPVALINTVWQNNKVVTPLLECCSLITCRESMSAAAIRQPGREVAVVPDLSLSVELQIRRRLDTKCESLAVIDSVYSSVSGALAGFARLNTAPFFHMGGGASASARDLWKWICARGRNRVERRLTRRSVRSIRDSEVIVTGRFHGVCLAILLNRPFVAITSNTHKIEGLLVDAELGPCGQLLKANELDKTDVRGLCRELKEAAADTKIQDEFRNACMEYRRKATIGGMATFRALVKLAKG